MLIIIAISLGAISSWFLLRLLIPQFQLGLLDQPNERSSHINPTPRGGGVVFVVVAFASSGIAFFSGYSSSVILLPLLATPLAIVGLLDDRYSLPATLRYGVQLLVAVFILLSSSLVQSICLLNVSCSLLSLFVVLLIMIAVTAVINFINFMDGLDGLVAGCMAVTISSTAVLLGSPFPLWALVGSLLGFLLWNWSPAKVFMGDVGSTFLGAVFAAYVLQASSWGDALCLLLIPSPLLCDACFCVVRRFLAGHHVFKAHRLHLFQRLYQAGWPHARVSTLYITATALLAFVNLVGGLPLVVIFFIFELLVGFWLDQNVAFPFIPVSRPSRHEVSSSDNA